MRQRASSLNVGTLDEIGLAGLIPKLLPGTDETLAIQRIREAARWYRGLRRREGDVPHRRRADLVTGASRMRRAREWLEKAAKPGGTIAEMLRWAAGAHAPGPERPSTRADERRRAAVVERGRAALAELERAIRRSLAVATGKPGDKSDFALIGLVDDLCRLWVAAGHRFSPHGKPLQRFAIELAQAVDASLAERRIRHALRVVAENRRKKSSKSAALG